ncbi:MAG: thioredoxin [Blastopirellula sp.]|nr:MAG: thioredoxin [Blastopirellula sp.]
MNSISRVFVLSLLVFPASVFAAPTVEQALQFGPIQADIQYEIPDSDQIKECSIKPEKIGESTGWVVYGSARQKLRQFLDTNGDKKVDVWAYYQNGVEVYRDIDADFNGKADQYRWLSTGGSRWGLDTDEDGKIDSWQMISAEEVSSEIVAAIRTNDSDRFQILVLNEADISALGLQGDKAVELKTKLAMSKEDFGAWVRSQKVISAKSKWVHFGATRPGVVPAGTDGATKDLVVYENVASVVETEGEHGQIDIGTLVRVGDVWKVISAPKSMSIASSSTGGEGFFFQASFSARPDAAGPMASFADTKTQLLLTELEALDVKLAEAASLDQRKKLNATRIELIEKLIAATSDAESKGNWVRQMADAISAGVQTGELDSGMGKLKQLADGLEKSVPGSDTAGYVKFRYMTAEYTTKLQDSEADFPKVQDAWLVSLKKFVTDYPKTDDAAEAILQLAIAHEFAGEETEAKKWYTKIQDNFSQTPLAIKAEGAIRRLGSVGKAISIKGETTNGKQFDLAAYKGRVVFIHYWATWCEPCKQDMLVIRQLQAKYGARGFHPIGISLDSSRQELDAFLSTSRLSWPQLYEEGGLDSRLASEQGVLTLPTVYLIGKDGKVISRSIHVSQLDAELSKLLK